jgi:hypothetical protein
MKYLFCHVTPREVYRLAHDAENGQRNACSLHQSLLMQPDSSFNRDCVGVFTFLEGAIELCKNLLIENIFYAPARP